MPTEFSHVTVKGLRRLRALEIDLEPMNVLVGPNGVGKSSVLDVFDLLASSAKGNLEKGLSRAGGISALLTSDGDVKSLQFELTRRALHNQPIIYSLKLDSRGAGYAVTGEFLTQKQNRTATQPFQFLSSHQSNVMYFDTTKTESGKPVGLTPPNWDFDFSETALSQVPKMFRDPENFRQLLASSTEIYHSLDVSERAPIRLPQSLQPADTPGSDGAQLLSCLYQLRENTRDRYDAIIDALRAAFPTFENIELPVVGAGTVTMRWKDSNFKSGHYPNQLSEGMLRFLWLATLLQSPGLPKLTLIDEPEISLHPRMLQLLAELMREASTRSQLIIATHSDRLVNFLKPDELVVCGLDDRGGMTAQRATDLDLEDWLKDYSLGELWTMGQLESQS